MGSLKYFRNWGTITITNNPRRTEFLNMGPLLGSEALAPPGQFLTTVTMSLGGVARSDDNDKGLALSEFPLNNAVQKTAVERTTELGRNEPRPPLPPVCAEASREQYCHHPMGSMFHPELDKDSLISIISGILEQPGFTNGPSDQRRLLRDVKTGRIDVRNMSRLLRWLGGEKGESVLRKRGVTFVGPIGGAGIHPYTSGLGMSHLVEVRITITTAVLRTLNRVLFWENSKFCNSDKEAI